MAKYTIEDTTLTAIADAIRSKTGGTETLTPQEMASSIEEIRPCFPNGTEWASLSSNNTNMGGKDCLSALFYANGMFLANKTNGSYWSYDGISWSKCGGIDYITIHAFRYANGMWIAASAAKGIWYSIDGKTWLQSNITSSSWDWDLESDPPISFHKGLWFVDRYRSINGKEWVESEHTPTGYADGLWSNGKYYSTDGILWTATNLPTSYSSYYGATYSSPVYANGLWVIGGQSTNSRGSGMGYFYSTDGINWIESNITEDSAGAILNAGGLWVIGSGYYHHTGIYYSVDGMLWTQSNVASGAFDRIVYANGVWVASGQHTDGIVYYSTDGMNWTATNLQSAKLDTIVNECGIWVAGGQRDNGGLYYSFDGIVWHQSNIKSGGYYYIVYGNKTWVGGYGSTVSCSPPTETVSAIVYSITWAPPTS